MESFITQHLDLWTTAYSPKTAGRGNGSSNIRLTGIQKLRELILELAVRGKLVPQDPNDEPAGELLKRIEAEKKRLVKEGKIKKQEILSEVTDNEKPYELPVGWNWTRIRSLGHDWGQKTPDSDFTYIDVSAIDNSRGEINSPTILTANEAPSRARKIVKFGTVLYSTVRPYLKNICVVSDNFNPDPIASTAFAIIHPYLQLPARYLLLCFQSPYFVKYVESVQNGIAYPAINDKQFFSGVIPLPPLPEQHRIVAKVNELMALCDELEQEETARLQAHETLVENLLTSLTNSRDARDFSEVWQRIETHFDLLFTTETSVDKLKQTILQLAVMGKLVPQDPTDEPASELLKKIAAEKAKLVKEGKIKKQAVLPEITEEEKSFELPKGWEWVRWDKIALKIGDIDHMMPQEQSVGYPYVSPRDFLPNNQIDFIGAKKISESDFLSLSAKIHPQKGDIIYPRYGTIGENRLVETDENFLASYSCCVIKTLHGFININYQFLFSISIFTKKQAKHAENKTTQANVGIKSIQNFIVPLPPLTEQHRIVSKVDELFALCDSLKERIREVQEVVNVMAGEVGKELLHNSI